jgi:hypothetical protein
VGAELPLICGTYDIVSIEVAGIEVPAACILNCDVNLDLIVSPEPGPEPGPSLDFNQMIPIPTSKPELFPGKGRRLGS